ncbi:DapH/DapD/GlmU-related protein [uncultured Bacteroides sp.]|uniref:acyltransferase n=1 Tax=uncultured Bacteroides sp. TaxID=162156 RepID=UPI00262C2757|nr:DapH/DapD/GlmU-related protein [uncultured Bacteroides sp.]
MKGKIILPQNIHFSIASIGLPGNEMFAYNTPNIWNDQGGKIIFQGSFGTNPGASFVIRNNALLQIGDKSSFGQNLRILCSKGITIGKELLASWDITIMDTDSHYFDENGKISEFSNEISIGNHCFIGSGASILKGTSIADNVVIASQAVASGKLSEASALYAGVPAIIKKHNIKYFK